MMLVWPKAERSLVPASADVNPLVWTSVTIMWAPSPSFPAAQERCFDSSSDRNSAHFVPSRRIKTVLHQDSCPIYSYFRRLAVLMVWKMPRFTAEALSHYKCCYIVVLRRFLFPYSCYSSCIMLSCYQSQHLSSLSWLLPIQSFYRKASEEKSAKLIVSCRPLDWIFLNITAVFQSCLRNFLSQIPLTCREFECPVPIMALETPPYICAMVSAYSGVLALL